MNAIQIDDVSFSYGKNRVLDHLNMKIPNGAIYGFLGRNGSGKTTTLKLIMGLLPIEKNRITFWNGQTLNPQLLGKIGSVVDCPSFYGHLTPKEHLKMLNVIFRKPDRHIDMVLNRVGLRECQDKKASKLSTGQKQRLALALAIFREPEIIVLDEPANGLDPIGVIELRDMIRELHSEGKTILVSSHIISEMEKICTHLGIIEKGRIVTECNLHEREIDNLENFYLKAIDADNLL